MRKPNAKERILETAATLFHQRGYSEVGINEIIQKAETAKASFYHYFPSKDALCEAWLGSLHERSETRRAELLSSESSPVEKVALYFKQMADYMTASDFRGCPFSNTCSVSDDSCCGVTDQIREHKESIRRFHRRLCAQRFDEPAIADETGDHIHLLYSGAATEAQNMKSLWPVEVASKAAQQLLS